MTTHHLNHQVDPSWSTDESHPDLFALLCQRRGWTPDLLAEIESSDHDQLKDLDTMVDALEGFRRAGQQVTIAPDFDMDGISSAMVGYAGLSELGFNVNLHVPDYERGHDLTVDDIIEVAERFPQTRALLTCDGGVNSHTGICAAQALGWTVLVTDHHQELEPGCNANVTVNPCRMDETYALKGICGAHVLYQVIEAHAAKYRPDKLWAIRLLRLFAGLGTISDVMPVLYENRQLVRDSLSIARLLHVPAPKTIQNRFGGFDPNPDEIDVEKATLVQLLRNEEHDPVFVNIMVGFALVLKGFAQHGKLREIDNLDEGFYGFYLAPAMNAPRRTGVPINDCFTVFTEADPEVKLAAMHRIIANNELRKELTIQYTAELVDGDQPLAPWVYFSEARPGMFGLLASQMMQEHGHPVVVLNRPLRADEAINGSGRAPAWFNIIDELEGHESLRGVGHQQACGVKLARADALDRLVEVLRTGTQVAMLSATQIGPVGDLVLGSTAEADASLSEQEPLFELVRRYETLKPFGSDFTEPVFEIIIHPGNMRPDRIGSDANCDHEEIEENGHYNERGYWVCLQCKKHLRVVTDGGLACLWWNIPKDESDELIKVSGQVDAEHVRFLGKLQLNTFMGETKLQVIIGRQLPGGT